jgi:calcium-dependent protein kinase
MGCCHNTRSITAKSTKTKRKISEKEKSFILISRKQTIIINNDENIENVYDIQENELSNGFSRKAKIGVLKLNGKKYAIQSIDKAQIDPNNLEKLKKYLEVLNIADHPNFIKFYETYNDEQFFHIVTENYEADDLYTQITDGKIINEVEASFIIYKIASALSHLHHMQLLHGSVKPENVILENISNDVKVIDIGLNKYIDKDSLVAFRENSPFEDTNRTKAIYDSKFDIWSLGVLLYFILSGEFPFLSKGNVVDLYARLKDEEVKYENKCWASVSNQVKELLVTLLNSDPSKRPSAAVLLNDPWFKNIHNQYSFNNLDSDIILPLRKYNKLGELKKIIYKFMLRELNQHEDISKIKKLFYMLDRNNSGFIDFNTIVSAFDYLAIKLEPNELMSLLNNDQPLSFSLFAYALMKKDLINLNIIETVFSILDYDDNGIITVDDISHIFKRVGKYKSYKEINDMFVKENIEEGDLDYEKFCTIIK